MGRINEILESEQEIETQGDKEISFENSVILDNVSFGYSETLVLKDIILK